MRAAINGVDVVGEAEYRLGVAVVVLQRDFDLHVVALRFHHDRLLVQHRLAAVQMLHELCDAAHVSELRAFRVAGLGIDGALIRQSDFQPFIQKREFAQPLRQRVVVVFSCGEDGLVRQEVDLGAALLADAGLAQFTGGIAAAEIHLPGVPVAPDLNIEFLRERIDATHADAVKATGNFVVRRIKFAARVQLGEDHLHRGHHLSFADGHHVHGNAAAVIDHGDGVVDVDGDFNFLGIAGKGLVDRVVYYFVNKMVQSHLAGRADVHGWAKPDCLQAFQNFDIFAGVVAVTVVAGSVAIIFHFAESSPSGGRAAGQSGARSRSQIWGLTA